MAKIDIEKEIETDEYKEEYNRSINMLNSLLQCLIFVKLNCQRDSSLAEKLFFNFIIDDILQSLVAIKMLLTEGIRNTCRRELRYLLELSMKACLVSQKYSNDDFEKQLSTYNKLIKSTNISNIDYINFHFFDDEYRKDFISEFKQTYGILCNYVHSTPLQMEERITLNNIGRTIGLEGKTELFELNNEMEKVFSHIVVLCCHAIPIWYVGDWMVEKNGDTINSYFQKSKFFAQIDKYFDYKCERQKNISIIKKARNDKIKF